METNRRNILGAIAAIPLAATSETIALPAFGVTPSAWSQAYACWKAADEAWDEHMATVYNPAVEEVTRRAPVPPLSFTITAKSGQSRTYYHDPRDPDAWTDEALGIVGVKARKLRSDYEAWKAQTDAAEQAIGFEAIEREDQRRCDASADARKAALATPVSSVAELAEKAAFITEQYEDSIDDELFGVILADIRRIAGEGR